MSRVKPITGTFFEIEHGGQAEGKYYNDAMRAFTEEQWRAKVRETAEIGIDTLILQATASHDPARAYFPFDEIPFAQKIQCKNAIEILLDEADKTGQDFYIGVGQYGTVDTVGNSTDPVIVAKALRAMDRLFELYGHHKSFVGWYVVDEWCIWDHFDERFITYINTVTAQSRALDPRLKVLVAPFGTHCLQADDVFVEQLSRIDADIIAYQDEVGVKKLDVEHVAERFELLRRAHDRAGRAKLWVDLESFTFEGDVYRSPLIPAPIDRIEKQVDALAPLVDKIIMYTYQGVFQAPDSIARCGHPDAEKLHRQYTERYV